MASKTRFVKLDEVDARRREGLELSGHNGNQRLGDGGSVGVDIPPLDATGECEWPGDRHLDRPKGKLAKALKLGHRAQPAGSRKGCDTPVAIALVVCRSAPEAGTANGFQAVNKLDRSPG